MFSKFHAKEIVLISTTFKFKVNSDKKLGHFEKYCKNSLDFLKDKNSNGEAETDMDEDGVVDQHVVGDEEADEEGEDHGQKEAGQSSFLRHLVLN